MRFFLTAVFVFMLMTNLFGWGMVLVDPEPAVIDAEQVIGVEFICLFCSIFLAWLAYIFSDAS